MDLLIKIFANRLKSENGFVLIAAIMAVMIMLAVSFFILTMSTQDIRMSSRLIAERRAMSAVECGAQAIYASATDLPTLALNNTNCPGTTHLPPCQCDPVDDNSLTYTATTQIIPGSASPGSDLSYGGYAPIYETIVTGNDATYGSSASIAIGMKPMSGPGGTFQGSFGSGGG